MPVYIRSMPMTLKRKKREMRRRTLTTMTTRKQMRPPPLESSLNFPTMTRRVAMKSQATWQLQSSSRRL
jgi:hypothetical protein